MSSQADPAGVAPASDEVSIDVCVCTYGRSLALARLIESLAVQRGAPRFRVLIADNHETAVEAASIEHLSRVHALELRHVHAPSGNISIARNACLDHARAPFIAFIDDDEIASPDWLARLAAAIEQHDVVFAPVRAQYAADAPGWLRSGDFHSKTPAQPRPGVCNTGHTANVLIRRRCIGTHRFDPALGRSGGEDTVFFALLKRDGARLHVELSAPVFEPVDQARASLRWLMLRAYGSGQAHARMMRVTRMPVGRVVAGAALKLLYCVLAGMLTCWSALRWRRNALRASLHLGVLSGLLGTRSLELYGRDPGMAG